MSAYQKQPSNEFADPIPVAKAIRSSNDDVTAAVYHPEAAPAQQQHFAVAHAATGDCRGCGQSFIRGEIGTAAVSRSL
jgi:hypothetical protein